MLNLSYFLNCDSSFAIFIATNCSMAIRIKYSGLKQFYFFGFNYKEMAIVKAYSPGCFQQKGKAEEERQRKVKSEDREPVKVMFEAFLSTRPNVEPLLIDTMRESSTNDWTTLRETEEIDDPVKAGKKDNCKQGVNLFRVSFLIFITLSFVRYDKGIWHKSITCPEM